MTKMPQRIFLQKRMRELREKNSVSQTDLAKRICCNKASISRVENTDCNVKMNTVREYAEKYCEVFRLTNEQKKTLLCGERAIVVDTSALMKNQQILSELSQDYGLIVIPSVVLHELNHLKDHNKRQAANAWRLIMNIGNGNEKIIHWPYNGGSNGESNDEMIIFAAREVSEKYNTMVDILTNDAGFAASLKGDPTIHSIHIAEYVKNRQKITDMDGLRKLGAYYSDSYADTEQKLGIRIPDTEWLNGYLPNGQTLIIAAVRNRRIPLKERTEKIRWLISRGADINRRDNSKAYFPPLTHAIQMNDFEMFRFLLTKCHANPNTGSKVPYGAEKLLQQNEGNMPLMVAAWHGRTRYVIELLKDSRTSINQQDANGFTALHKACFRGNTACRDLLLKAGIDTKIVDRDGFTADERLQQYQKKSKIKRR